MNITMMTTWNARCGVAEYSRVLTRSLSTLGHTVQQIVNYPHDLSLPSLEDPSVHPCFDVTIRTNNIRFDMDRALSVALSGDLLHIQFETSMYHPEWMPAFIQMVADRIPVVVTMHSAGIWPTFPTDRVNTYICHDASVETWLSSMRCPVKRIYMGVNTNILDKQHFPKRHPKTLTSFGLGRNMNELCIPATERAGWKFDGYFSDRSAWLSEDALDKLLLKSAAIALIYPPIGTGVSSSAAAYALKFPCPLIVSNTNWFKWLDDYTLPGVYKVNLTVDSIASVLSSLKDYSSETFSVERLAAVKSQKLDYSSAVVKPHLEVYSSAVE